MKKVLSMLLVIILAVSMVGCSGSVKEAEPQQETATPTPNPAILLYEKYSDIISALEEKNYDGAVSLIEELKPTPEVPPIKEVTITTDNFFDYFELNRQIKTNYAEKDSQGKITAIDREVSYVLKEEYRIAEEKKRDCIVEIGLKYDYLYHYSIVDVDFDSFSFTSTEEPHLDKQDEWMKGLIPINGNRDRYEIWLGYERLSLDYARIIDTDSIELVSASGTIYIYE